MLMRPWRAWRRRRAARRAWDLTALLNAADPKASLPERHLWLIRVLAWLRHASLSDEAASLTGSTPFRPTPVLRLKHLLNVLERNAEHRQRVALVLSVFWREVDVAALFADFGFGPRGAFLGELGRRVRAHVLPLTPATTDLGELFALLFPHESDAEWLEAVDAVTLDRLVRLITPEATADRPDAGLAPLQDAILFLGSEVRAAGFAGPLRQRMSPELLVDAPFHQLARVSESFRDHAEAGDEVALLREANVLRALLDSCRRCAESVHDHLGEHGVSINIVFEVEQLRERTYRIDQLLTCVVSPTPASEVARLTAELVRTARRQRSVRALIAQHYSLLARKVAERSAETGQHYITRDRSEYGGMLRAAAGGGAVLGATTLIKFAVLALPLTAFWGGLMAGINYAASFLVVQLLHFTVATKQPAMTAHAMAEKLGDVSNPAAVEGFVDEVANLIRSQSAGIIGNLMLVAPVVLAVQLGWERWRGHPLVGQVASDHVLSSLSLLGGTPFYAAFTGVLLFASSLIAGWVENWFVWHRLDSAIAWNPRILDRLGAARARRWSRYWRANISGFASNISLGLMLGLIPAVASFFALPIEVRHVTLSTGQLAAAVGAEGFGVMRHAPFWWCVAGIVVTGGLNVGVSFFLAFKVAMRSRGIRLADRSRIYRAVRQRLRQHPLSFIVPPRLKRAPATR